MRLTFHLAAAVAAALTVTTVAAAQKAMTGNGALGTPGGQSKIATCATFVDPITGVSTILCSTDNEVFVRGTGKSSFRNVTSALTTITLVAGSPAELACGTPSVSLFDTCLQDFLWQYDNNGLKLLQIRFYPS